MRAGRSWFDDARQVSVADVATALGLEARRGALTPCPACNASQRGRDDKRGPVMVRGGWSCVRCDAKGDAIGLAALTLTGQSSRLTGAQWSQVRAWYASRGWCDADPQANAAAAPLPVRRPPPKPEPERAVERLDPLEVAALWDAAVPAFTDSRTRRWLDARGGSWGHLDPAAAVASLDLARALPPGLPCPSWASFRGRSWPDGGRSLVLPCYGPRGELVGLRARWTGTERGEERWEELPAPDGAKEISPRGSGALRGSVYACPVGRWLLAQGPEARRGGCPDQSAPAVQWDGRVFIFEGGPTWLRYAADPSRVRMADGVGWTPAVLGVWAGAWPTDGAGAELAARMTGAELVTVATDDDPSGDGYAARIADALEAVGVRVGRANKRGGRDG